MGHTSQMNCSLRGPCGRGRKWEEGVLGKVKPKRSLLPFEAIRVLRLPPENETEPSRLDLREEGHQRRDGACVGHRGQQEGRTCAGRFPRRSVAGRSFSANVPRTAQRTDRQPPGAGG